MPTYVAVPLVQCLSTWFGTYTISTHHLLSNVKAQTSKKLKRGLLLRCLSRLCRGRGTILGASISAFTAVALLSNCDWFHSLYVHSFILWLHRNLFQGTTKYFVILGSLECKYAKSVKTYIYAHALHARGRTCWIVNALGPRFLSAVLSYVIATAHFHLSQHQRLDTLLCWVWRMSLSPKSVTSHRSVSHWLLLIALDLSNCSAESLQRNH